MLKALCIIPVVLVLTSCANIVLQNYNQNYESSSDFATLEFSNFSKTRVQDLYICQNDNTGFVALPKNKTIKVKANEPTHIQMVVRNKRYSCPVRLNTIFSPGKKYYLSSGIAYEKTSIAKLLFIGGLNFSCKAFLDDQKITTHYSQLNEFPLSGVNCVHFKKGSLDKVKNIVSADKWINLNNSLKKAKKIK